MKEAVTILKESLLTEKATMLSSKLNQYLFSVTPSLQSLISKER